MNGGDARCEVAHEAKRTVWDRRCERREQADGDQRRRRSHGREGCGRGRCGHTGIGPPPRRARAELIVATSADGKSRIGRGAAGGRLFLLGRFSDADPPTPSIAMSIAPPVALGYSTNNYACLSPARPASRSECHARQFRQSLRQAATVAQHEPRPLHRASTHTAAIASCRTPSASSSRRPARARASRRPDPRRPAAPPPRARRCAASRTPKGAGRRGLRREDFSAGYTTAAGGRIFG